MIEIGGKLEAFGGKKGVIGLVGGRMKLQCKSVSANRHFWGLGLAGMADAIGGS
jgi:hypothetical protein